jgi:hypothetical protein
MIACHSLDRGFAEHVEPKQRIDMIVDGRAVLGFKIVTPAEFLEIQSRRGRER